MQSNNSIDNKSRRTAITPRNGAGRPASGAPAIKKPRADLLCEHCQQAESTHLIYYRRYHIESGRYSLINPRIVCDHCIQLFKDSNLLLEHQPVIVPFEVIGRQWDWRFAGILSRKGYEFNALAHNKYWYKKLKRVKLIWKNPSRSQQ